MPTDPPPEQGLTITGKESSSPSWTSLPSANTNAGVQTPW